MPGDELRTVLAQAAEVAQHVGVEFVGSRPFRQVRPALADVFLTAPRTTLRPSRRAVRRLGASAIARRSAVGRARTRRLARAAVALGLRLVTWCVPVALLPRVFRRCGRRLTEAGAQVRAETDVPSRAGCPVVAGMIGTAGVAVVPAWPVVPAVVTPRPVTRRAPGTIVVRTAAVCARGIAFVGRVTRAILMRAVRVLAILVLAILVLAVGAARRSVPAILGAARCVFVLARSILPVLPRWALRSVRGSRTGIRPIPAGSRCSLAGCPAAARPLGPLPLCATAIRAIASVARVGRTSTACGTSGGRPVGIRAFAARTFPIGGIAIRSGTVWTITVWTITVWACAIVMRRPSLRAISLVTTPVVGGTIPIGGRLTAVRTFATGAAPAATIRRRATTVRALTTRTIPIRRRATTVRALTTRTVPIRRRATTVRALTTRTVTIRRRATTVRALTTRTGPAGTIGSGTAPVRALTTRTIPFRA